MSLSPHITVAAAAALAIAVTACGRHGVAGPASPRVPALAPAPVVAFEPRLSREEAKYLGRAWLATVASDHACRGFHGPELTQGAPTSALSSSFAILREPASPGHQVRRALHWSAGAQFYLNQVRRARTAFGAKFYVLPAGNVSGQRGVPARCGAEQVRVLRSRLRHLGPRGRARILGAQRRWLAYLRYSALHAEGICAGYFTAARAAGDDMCATMAEFQRWGVLVDASVYLDHAAVFWTVVPDGVAKVTLRFARRGEPLTGPFTTTVRAVNNMVIAKEPYRAPYASGFPSTIVLRGADGRILRQTAVTPNMPTICGYGC